MMHLQNKNENLPAAKQQELLLNKMNRKDSVPTRNFCKDIMVLIAKLKEENNKSIPIIIGDWNEKYKGSLISKQLCN